MTWSFTCARESAVQSPLAVTHSQVGRDGTYQPGDIDNSAGLRIRLTMSGLNRGAAGLSNQERVQLFRGVLSEVTRREPLMEARYWVVPHDEGDAWRAESAADLKHHYVTFDKCHGVKRVSLNFEIFTDPAQVTHDGPNLSSKRVDFGYDPLSTSIGGVDARTAGRAFEMTGPPTLSLSPTSAAHSPRLTASSQPQLDWPWSIQGIAHRQGSFFSDADNAPEADISAALSGAFPSGHFDSDLPALAAPPEDRCQQSSHVSADRAREEAEADKEEPIFNINSLVSGL